MGSGRWRPGGEKDREKQRLSKAGCGTVGRAGPTLQRQPDPRDRWHGGAGGLTSRILFPWHQEADSAQAADFAASSLPGHKYTE